MILLQGLYVMYLELVTDLLNLLVYLIFFIVVFLNYGLPLHLVWPRYHYHPPNFCLLYNHRNAWC